MFNITLSYITSPTDGPDISVLSSGEATMIVAALLYNNWLGDAAEGDGPSDWTAAKKQATEMVQQTISNRLNLDADGVSVQWVTSAEVRAS